MPAINSGVMKRLNRRMVLSWIRRRPISRAELSDCTRLTRASITQIVDELMAEGLVSETQSVGNSRLGRRPKQLNIVPDALYIAGVNLGRKSYDLGVIDLKGTVRWQVLGEVQGREPGAVLDEIAARLKDAVRDLKIPAGRFHGVGICAPGPVNAKSGAMRNPPNFDAWHGMPVVAMLEARTGWDAALNNASSAHALEELYFGVGCEGIRNFMLLRVDDGVGAGIVLNGSPFVGARGQCPELGHLAIDRNGPPCACGNRGCWEQYVSLPAALRGTGFDAWSQVIDNLGRDPEADAVFGRMAENLAFEIANIINLFGLERIVLGGQLIYGGAALAEAVNANLWGRTLWKPDGAPVVPGRQTEGARIAAMAAYHAIFSND